MKKRILSILLVLTLCMGLLPMTVFAEPTKLNNVDITIELPKGGDAFDFGYIPKLTSLKSGNIDLLATGAYIFNTYWNGDVDYDENGTPLFRTGGTYYVTIQLGLNIEAGYCANYVVSNGEYLVKPETFSATVNGFTATTVHYKPIYFPAVEISLTLDGEVLNETEKNERSEERDALTQTRRAMYTPRTWAESEAYNLDNLPEKVVVVNTDGTDLRYDFENITSIVMDVNNAEKMVDYLAHHGTLKEIWLSAESDPYKFARAMDKALFNPITLYYYYNSRSDIPMYTSESTLFIPESKASEFQKQVDELGFLIPSVIRTYSGNDVVAAQKAGASATKELCTTHKYTKQIRSADRVYTWDDGCQHTQVTSLFYYSCEYCDKCEYNPNHVDPDLTLDFPSVSQTCYYHNEFPNDSAYIGVNAAGQHVWWLSCAVCGNPYSDDMLHPDTSDQKAVSRTDISFEEFQALEKAALEKDEAQALASTELYPNTFTLPAKSDAKMSSWAQSDVNLALNDNLLDTATLGNDYTQNISRLQFCSIVVRLAEELTGKSITPADSNTFTDTSDSYALKAYAAGITSGVTATTFDPNGTLNRQQMATFLYRTLRYVENNSDYKYTSYDSKLANYTDSIQVQSWAEEAMAFMNALDLIKGTTDTTLNPNGLCTIEQAIIVAERSVYAHQIGWYQVDPYKTIFNGTTKEWRAEQAYTSIAFGATLHEGDYVWVTGRRYGVSNNYSEERYNLPYTYAPVINPFNGQISEVKNGDIIPVRD